MNKKAVHGHRRGLAPLSARLTTVIQREGRGQKIERRKLEKLVAKLNTRVKGRKEKKP